MKLLLVGLKALSERFSYWLFNLCHLHFVVIFLFFFPFLMYLFFFFFNKTSLSGYSATSASSSDCHLRSMKSTDHGFFLPVHTLSWMCYEHLWVFMWKGQRLHVVKKVHTKISKYLEMKSQEMFKGQLLKVHCYHWNYDLVLFLRDWFGNCGDKWKSLFSTKVSWTCTGFPVLFWFSRSLFPVPSLQKVHAIPIKCLH